ncbi:alpha-L-glutamate ligase-like protein, partial [Patescibacteria group bacterium]|nr:alpha-L-glutamate ligase-like protein [Patescibacteria group bacterium]
MPVSKQPLGINARNFLFLKRYNKPRAKRVADDKLMTKELFLECGIPVPTLLAKFTHLAKARSFDWTTLPRSFVLKPAH